MQRDAVEALVRRTVEAWLRADADAAAADFAEDGVLISPMGTWLGPAGVRRAVQEFHAEARVIDIQVRGVVVDGDDGAVEWTWTEQRSGDPVPVTMEDAIVFRLREGRIVYWREYFDPAQTAPAALV